MTHYKMSVKQYKGYNINYNQLTCSYDSWSIESQKSLHGKTLMEIKKAINEDIFANHRDNDKRYQINHCFCGYPKKMFMLYFCGKHLGTFETKEIALCIAQSHYENEVLTIGGF